jgi:hypothetical protein
VTTDHARSDRRRSRTRRVGCTALVVLLVAALALLPCTFRILDGEAWVRSAHSLQNIGVAMHEYHARHGRLPPAVVRDKDGRPLYSWRVLLLPYLGDGDDVYRRFRLDEPWDSPHNKPLAEETPRCYRPALGAIDPPGLTRYQVLVGPGTAFERPGLTWDDFPDGRDQTLLVVEAAEPVPWSKPADLVYEPDGPLPKLGAGFTKPTHFLCYTVCRTEGFNAAFAGGGTRFLRSGASEQALRAVITRNGGEKVDWSDLE